MIGPSWVIGAGGLLGQALARRSPSTFRADLIPWNSEGSSQEELISQTIRYREVVGDSPWTVLWAAGAAVTAVDDRSAEAELAVFEAALSAVREHLPARNGVFFLASSAGGVYAGGPGAPYDESSVPAPISPYGRLKLRQETMTQDILGGHAHVVVGRFSNLYGPGQNLRKPQGLVSQLCRAALTHRVTNLYVPLETMRDYLFVDDAAALAWATIEGVRHRESTTPTMRVFCSEEHATVARLLGLIDRQSHRRCLISLGVHASSGYQVRDLRLRSLHRSEQKGLVQTTLTVGVSRILRFTGESLRAGGLQQ